jgi:hypothetical protein
MTPHASESLWQLCGTHAGHVRGMTAEEVTKAQATVNILRRRAHDLTVGKNPYPRCVLCIAKICNAATSAPSQIYLHDG